jgi:transposase
MLYVGLDVHEKYTQIQAMDEAGFLAMTEKLPTTAESLGSFFSRLPDSAAVSLEAGRNYWWISQFLSSHTIVEEFKVVDSRRSRILAKEFSVRYGYGRAKNDRIDAEMLAHIHREGMSPSIHLPTEEQLGWRTLVRHRMGLVQQSTAAGGRLQGLLSMHGVRMSTRSLTDDFQSQLESLESLPNYARCTLQHLLEHIRLYQRQIKHCERRLSKCLPSSHPQIKILMTAPGIGIVLARIMLSEILSIHYFDAPKYLMSYAGLAPIENTSGGKKGVIELNRHCNYYLKYAFVQAAHTARQNPKYRKKYNQDEKRHGKTRAKINLARRMVKAVYWMLTRQESFHAW